MWELLAAERTVETEIGRPCQLRYYILTEEAELAGSLLCETYGVRIVTARDGKVQAESLRHITFYLSEISRLIQVLGGLPGHTGCVAGRGGGLVAGRRIKNRDRADQPCLCCYWESALFLGLKAVF